MIAKFGKMKLDKQKFPHPHQRIVFELKTHFPWASTTIKIMVDPISMIKTLK